MGRRKLRTKDQKFASRGGKGFLKKYGLKGIKEISQLGVEARARKRANLSLINHLSPTDVASTDKTV